MIEMGNITTVASSGDSYLSQMNEFNDTPLVTIGVPFKNPGQWFELCLRSIFAQTWSNWELLLIDDGSTDGSLEFARKLTDSRVKIVTDGTNKGLACRLNQIARNARGVYLFRMDADDVMHPDRLASTLTALIGQKSLELISTWAYAIDLHSQINGLRVSNSEITGWAVRHRFIHPSVAGKREWFVNNPYSELPEHARAEDAELWLRTVGTLSCQTLPIPLLYYRELGMQGMSNYERTASGLLHLIRSSSSMTPFEKRIRILQTRFKTILMKCFHATGCADFLISRRSLPISREMSIVGESGLDRIRAVSLPGIDP